MMSVVSADQNQQALRNRSTTAIVDTMYKNALGEHYKTTAANALQKQKADQVYRQAKLRLDSLTTLSQLETDTAQRAKYLQEAQKLKQYIDSYEAGTTPEQIRANTGVRAENRNTSQYLLDEEKHERNTEFERQKIAISQELNNIRKESNEIAAARKNTLNEIDSADLDRRQEAHRLKKLTTLNKVMSDASDPELDDEVRMAATSSMLDYLENETGSSFMYGDHKVTAEDIFETMDDEDIDFMTVINRLVRLEENR